MFIGILGERYGLIPDKIPENTLIQYPWLKNYSGHSVTALEILHALHLPDFSVRCSFYFRDPEIVSIMPLDRRLYYAAKDHEETLKVKKLKDTIRASGRPTIENYPCQWDDEKKCLVGLRTFGEDVLNVLCHDINMLYRNIEVENVSIVHNIEFGVQEKPSKQPLYLDENVQFTVYRPKKIQPIKWYPLLTFAHLSERPPDAKEDEPDPIEEVQKQAKQILGEQVDNYADLTQDSRQAVPRQGEITLVPEVPGIEFNPPSRSFLWTEAVHKEEFRIRASQQLDGKMAEGRISVFLSGSIVLAEIGLRIKVDSREQYKTSSIPYEHISSRAYRRIFASYSRKDLEIVEEFEKYAHAVGDEYLRDLVHIHTGEVWDERLIQMISQADIFQLFWSWNSMRSKFVEREWKYALSLKRSQFVRPVYWEDPLPELKEENLPPEELQKLHFQRLPIKTTSVKYLQEQKNQEQLKRSTKQGKKIAKTIPGTSKTTNPSHKKTLHKSMLICLPIVFIGGLVIGIDQYMDFSVRKVNTSLEEINAIASKNKPHRLLQNRTMDLLCQKGIDPEEIESAKQIEEEELNANIIKAKKEEISNKGSIQLPVDGKNTIASKEELKKFLQTQFMSQKLQIETKDDMKNSERKQILLELAETDKQSNVEEDKNKLDTATKTKQKPMQVASKDSVNSGKMTLWNSNASGSVGSKPDESKNDIKSSGKKQISPVKLAETDKQSNVEEDKNKLDMARKPKQKPMQVASKDSINLIGNGKFGNMCNLPRNTKEFRHFSKSISNKDSVDTECASTNSQLRIKPEDISVNPGNINIEKETQRNFNLTIKDECKAIESKANINSKFYEALKLFEEQGLICKKEGNKDGLQSSLGNQALIFIELGELNKALELLSEKEHICREIGNNIELVSSLINQAVILSQRMNCLREALPLAEEAYKLAAKEGLVEQTKQTEQIINSIKNKK